MGFRIAKRNFEEVEELDTEGTWAVSYGDLVTLLLTFFIIFFSTDPKQGTKQKIELKVSLIETLKSKSAAPSETGHREELNVGNKNEQGIDPEILKKWNGVIHDKGNHIIIEFPYVSFFKSGQTDLTQEGKEALTNFVKVYLPYAGNYWINVLGYTDIRKVRWNSHRYKDNLELSALRSISGVRTLQISGIPLNRLKVGGIGDLALTASELQAIPLEKRGPSAELALARKIVLVIEPEDSK